MSNIKNKNGAVIGGDGGGGKILLLLILLFSLASCSFKHSDSNVDNLISGGADYKTDINEDSDGDGLSDKLEIDRGTDPKIADIPLIETNFIQNFNINVNYNKIGDSTPLNLAITTKVKNNDPSFKYRVGKLFGIENAKVFAAKEGRFSNHSYGIIKNEDFTWVKYPSLDPLMHHFDIIKYRPIIDNFDNEKDPLYENINISLNLESSIKLSGPKFKEIKDLSLNFYYHDYKKETYVLLKNIVVNRTFQKNINENFSVEIENIPVIFLQDTYLRHGEFLITEIDNYFIPELNTDYKTLMAKVKSKTVPVLFTTPIENIIYYVATNANGISFLNVLERIFVKNYEVENNILKRIGQFENNLGNFEHLIEVKDKDKLGKWFVLTNKFKEHFIDHLYTTDDHITLSYLTGNVLASQVNNLEATYNSKITTETYNEVAIPIGLVSPNSKIEIQLKGIERFGHELESTPINNSYSSSCSNCTKLAYSCSWIGNKRIEFLRDFNLSINYNEEWEKIYLVINEERFKLSTLIAEKKVSISNLNFSFQLSLDDIVKIKPIKESEENKLSLVIVANLEKSHQGIKLLSQGGAQNMSWCTANMRGIDGTIELAASRYNNEISKGTKDALLLNELILNAHKYPNNSDTPQLLKLKMMDDIDYEKNYSIALSSKVINYFN